MAWPLYTIDRHRNNSNVHQQMTRWRECEHTASTHSGILFNFIKGGNPAICYNVDESWGHQTKWNKPGIYGHKLYDSTSKRLLRSSNSQKQRVLWCLPRAVGGVTWELHLASLQFLFYNIRSRDLLYSIVPIHNTLLCTSKFVRMIIGSIPGITRKDYCLKSHYISVIVCAGMKLELAWWTVKHFRFENDTDEIF